MKIDKKLPVKVDVHIGNTIQSELNWFESIGEIKGYLRHKYRGNGIIDVDVFQKVGYSKTFKVNSNI